MTVFGVSGVAGKVGGEVTLEIALMVGRAIGRQYRSVVLSRDVKGTGPMISAALTSGLCSVGCDVTNVEVCPLPTSVRAIRKDGCGIMVTAPRGPSGYSWIRFINFDGSSFAERQLDVLSGVVSGDVDAPYAKHDDIGLMTMQAPPIAAHIKEIVGDIGNIDCPVIVDCASDSASLITPTLLADMGADVITINSCIGRSLTGRHPEPVEANLRDLMRYVRSEPGSIGIAHDGSGSRVGVIDESGRYVCGNTLLALFASHLKVDSIAVPVDATIAIDDIVKGDVIRTKIGDDHVAEAMKANRLSFGGESSGTFIFGDRSFCPDGIYAAALAASIASEGSLRQSVDELPYYPICKSDVRINCDKEDLAKRLDEKISSTEYVTLNKADGWRVEMDDGWYLIRLSHFENKVRITAEARDRIYMNCLMDIASDVVASCIR